MKTQKGLIGFFDILGYKSLLANNKLEIITESVLPLLTNLKTKLPDLLKNQVSKELINVDLKGFSPEEIEGYLNKYIDEVKWLVFSDTILLSMQIESIAKETLKMGVFFTASTHLLKEMFDEGLPLRGAIDFGNYHIESNFFAGQPIVNSYLLSESLELSACVLSDNVKKEINDLLREESLATSKFKHHLLWYLVPTKNGEKDCYALSYAPSVIQDADLKSAVLSSFWRHNKSIPLSIQNKIENTEKWFHFVQFNKNKIK